MVDMGKRAVAVSLGLTYCVVMVAWGFALIKMGGWLHDGIPLLARTVAERLKVVASDRPALFSPSADSYAVISGSPIRLQPKDCDPTEPTRCVLLPINANPPPPELLPAGPGDRDGTSRQARLDSESHDREAVPSERMSRHGKTDYSESAAR